MKKKIIIVAIAAALSTQSLAITSRKMNLSYVPQENSELLIQDSELSGNKRSELSKPLRHLKQAALLVACLPLIACQPKAPQVANDMMKQEPYFGSLTTTVDFYRPNQKNKKKVHPGTVAYVRTIPSVKNFWKSGKFIGVFTEDIGYTWNEYSLTHLDVSGLRFSEKIEKLITSDKIEMKSVNIHANVAIRGVNPNTKGEDGEVLSETERKEVLEQSVKEIIELHGGNKWYFVIMQERLRNGGRAILSNATSEEINNQDTKTINQKALFDQVNEVLEGTPFILESIEIGNAELPEEVVAANQAVQLSAINTKNAVEQEKFFLQQKKVNQAKAEANAAGNNKIQQSLTPEILKTMEMETRIKIEEIRANSANAKTYVTNDGSGLIITDSK